VKKRALHIGTSGWHYKHWKGRFYPADIKESDQLDYFIQHFKTVEINNSFYRLPAAEVFTGWRKATPDDFIFAVKASRYITHMKKLKPDKESLTLFFSHATKLKEKLGPVLFQLPPSWKVNAPRLDEFLASLPEGYQYCFEFRNHTWYTDEVYDILKKYNSAFCIYELEHHTSPIIITADFVYLRLHGPGNKYQGSYSDDVLKQWAKKCNEWLKHKKQVYVYFDNDQEAYAVFNAKRLMELV